MSTHLARPQGAIALVASLALLALGAPVSGGSPSACRVKNLDTNTTKSTLQAAVDGAAAGARLTVKGTCHGTPTIDRDLDISGIGTRASGPPTLDGDGGDTVVTVVGGVTVTIRNLTILDGNGLDGGGIDSHGTMDLYDVTVRDNTTASDGGGINSYGTLRLHGSSSISGNSGFHPAGGVTNASATLVMNDSSSIHGNSGGGVGLSGRARLEIYDSRSIFGNGNVSPGGGLRIDAGASLVGVICAPAEGANVHDNTPDDCYFVP